MGRALPVAANQSQGGIAPFPPGIWNFITVNDAPRRGFGEGDDGFCHDQDLTTSV